MPDMHSQRNRSKYASVIRFNQEDNMAGSAPNPNMYAGDLQWKADQAMKVADQYTNSIAKVAGRAIAEANAGKEAFSRWEAICKKADSAGTGALTQQEKNFYDTFHQLHPSYDEKRKLFSSLFASLDRKISSNAPIIAEALRLDLNAQNARIEFLRSPQAEKDSSLWQGDTSDIWFQTGRVSYPVPSTAGGTMANTGLSLSEARKYLISQGMDKELVGSLLPEIAVENQNRRVIPYQNKDRNAGTNASGQAEPLVKTFNQFHSVLEGLTIPEVKAYFLLRGMPSDWVADIRSDEDVKQIIASGKEHWSALYSFNGYSTADQTVMTWIQNRYLEAEESGDTHYMDRLARLFQEYYGEAFKRKQDKYTSFFSRDNDGLYSYHDWSEEGLPPYMSGFVVEYLTKDRLFKNGGDPTPEQRTAYAVLQAAASAVMGIPAVAGNILTLAENLSYIGAIKQYMEYNPGFILQEGDLMVYDVGITSYYRGDEFLYSKDYYGEEVFGPDYVRHIPGLNERTAEALENMIYDVVLADHSQR